jgi:hypothetical protein
MTSRLLVDKIEGKTSSSAVQMPSGVPIQYKRESTQANLGTITSTSYVKLGGGALDLTITPKFSTSKLVLHGAFPVYVSTNAYPSTIFAFYRDGTIIDQHNVTYGAGYVQINTGQLAGFHTYVSAEVDANNTNSTTFTIYVKSNTSSGNNSYFTDLANRWISVEEIAQ